MSLLYRTFLRPAIFVQDSENAHRRLLSTLSRTSRSRLLKSMMGNLYSSPNLPVNLFNLEFENPLGVAAGMDKNGEALPAWESIGFGFCEIGGVTLHEQPGNPKPRMFRATSEKALVNRMGFNNLGAREVSQNLKIWRERGLWPGSPVGINLGKSKITALADAPEDYAGSLELLWNYADFFVINVSSPNTPGLRDLQNSEHLNSIFSKCQSVNDQCSNKHSKDSKPILVKVDPEISDDSLEQLMNQIKKHNIRGIIATNTTVSRPQTDNLKSEKVFSEEGGLSGLPLNKLSTELIRKIYRMTNGELPIIGVGGIFTADDAWEKFTAGASLIQLYTGLVFEGPSIAKSIVAGLKKRLKAEGFSNILEIVGKDS